MRLHGIVPMLVAPYAADGGICLPEVAALAELCAAEGAHGIAVNGIGGEVGALSMAERRAIAETAIGAAAGLGVVVGASAADTATAVELATHAASAGAAAVMVAPAVAGSGGPAPAGETSRDALLAHYAAVAEAIDPTPLMVQDAPQFVGVALDAAFVGELATAHANVRYAKPESAPAAEAVAALASDERLGVFGGNGGLYTLDVLDVGGAGLIPGCEHVRGYVAIYEAWRRGHSEETRRRYAELLPLAVAQFQSLDCFIAATKAVLVARGVIARGDVRGGSRPFGQTGLRLLLDHARRAGALPPTTAAPANAPRRSPAPHTGRTSDA